MQEKSPMGIDDTDLMAYVDGGLSQTRKAEVETAVATTPDLAERLRAMRASALPYATAFEAQVLPAPPEKLLQLLLVRNRPSLQQFENRLMSGKLAHE